jgi:hypothetical protein
MTNPNHGRGFGGGSTWPSLGLLLLGLGLTGCGKAGPVEVPSQNGKPAEPAAPEPKPEAAPQSVSPSTLEKDRAAEEAPAARQLAPPAPATSAKPAGQARRAAPSKAAPRAQRNDTGDSLDWSVSGAAPRPPLLRQRLAELLKQSTPDCPSARDRKQAICDLASQICQLVDRDPDVASVESYCEDAKQRCSDAQRRTAQRCK